MDERLSGAVTLPDGTPVRGRGRRKPTPAGPRPTYGLYLGPPPDRHRRVPFRSRGAVWRPDWPADWIDWPDFRTPRDDRAAADAIHHAYRLARSGQRVEVACGGGVGRTGTVIACMVVLAGHAPAEAISWTREHYTPRAVETRGQRRWVGWFAGYRRTSS
ncbi:MAG: phosphatase [Pseudonocardia sp.]|nr:phosphatase [Pseudonocardia sp.]